MYRPSFDSNEIRVQTPSFWLRDQKDRKILYTYIRKNACTTFKNFIMASEDIETFVGNPKVLARLVKKDALCESEIDLSIFVYRDPYERLISAYVNKFVSLSGNADVFRNYSSLTSKKPEEATLLDIIEYLEMDLGDVDSHFWPQKAHLLPITYTTPINIKNISKTMNDIFGGQPHVETFTKRSNSSKQANFEDHTLINTPANVLRDMYLKQQRFSTRNFSTPETRARIEALYSNDYDMIRDLEKA